MGDKFSELGKLLQNNDWDGVLKCPPDNTTIQFVMNPLAGLGTFAVDCLLIYILTELGVNFLISTAVASITATTANYYLCKKIDF